ncbi:MAG TPA: site-specific integrase [Telluria sp.]
MSLYKRDNTWWIDFTTVSGDRIRCSTDTSNKLEAQEFHDRLKAASWRVERLGERRQYTWDDAAAKWLDETSHKRTHHDDVLKLRWLAQYLEGKLLTDVTRDVVAAIGARKRAVASPATANRHLALIRAILRRARDEWEWIEKAPKIKLYREAKRRVRWITPEQAQALLAELPEHQREMVLFALATGLRQGNVTGLCWSQVDLARRTAWVHGEDVKNGDDLHVSLNDLAMSVLGRQRGKHPERVFTYRGKPIKWANTRGWRSALVRAGIATFRWHDLRHTWASWLIQHGTPLYDLQEMGGWKSAEMVRRYAHLAPAKMAQNAAAIDALLHVTNTSQGRFRSDEKRGYGTP